MPSARDAVRRHPLDALAAKADRAGLRPASSPMIERTVVVLPMPLRPSSVATSPGCDREVDAEQDLAGAVAGLAGRRPRAAKSCGLLAEVGRAPPDWRGSPRACRVAMTPPVDQHRDAVGEAEHRVHVVLDQQHRHAARGALRCSAIMRCDSSGPMPAIGSSSSTSFGRVASARPTSSGALLAVGQRAGELIGAVARRPTSSASARARRTARSRARPAARTRSSSRCAPAPRAPGCRAR